MILWYKLIKSDRRLHVSQRHLTGLMAWIEKKILKNSKIKHLGEKPGDFGEIKVTTHSIFDKKGQKFWVWKRMRFTDITLPMK